MDILKFRIESNVRIHTYEENDWNIKGKYETALEDDDEVTWMTINRNYVLPMWLVSDKLIVFFINQITIGCFVFLGKRFTPIRGFKLFCRCYSSFDSWWNPTFSYASPTFCFSQG
jgi:hypothetical protein